MATRHTPSVSIEPDLLRAIDRVATKRHWKRSFLIQEAVRDWLRAEREPISVPEGNALTEAK